MVDLNKVTVLWQPKSLGRVEPIKSWMQCINAADGEYILLLDGSLQLEARVIEALSAVFHEFEHVGLVGSNILLSNEVPIPVDDVKSFNNFDKSWVGYFGRDALDISFIQQVDFLSASILLIKREIWRSLTLFEELYSVEDNFGVHLSQRVRELGYKCLYVPSIQVAYKEGVVIRSVDTKCVGKAAEINRLQLKARWHRSISGKASSSMVTAANCVLGDIKRALFVDFETPRPDFNAGGYAAIKEMRVLQSLGYQITFVPKYLDYEGPYTEALQRMGVECIYAPIWLNFDEFLSKRGREFSFIYITRHHVAQSVLPQLRHYAPTAKILLMLADLHFLRELRAALHNKNDEQLSQAVETRENELAVMRKVDLVLSYSDVEKTVILSHNLASTKVAKCPWVCDVVESVSGFENRVDIAFLGGFNHSPNVEAMVWFIEQVWPDLLEQLPEAQLRIYGSAIPQSIKDLAAGKARIQVNGWVGDVASVYNSCRVFIAPLQSGAGIKGKVIGALAHGVPSVLSDIAVEGIGVCDEIHAFVASSLDQWVNRIMTLYTDQALWEQMSQHALSFAKRNYSLDKAIVEMKAALTTVGIEPILEPKALVWKGPRRSFAQV